ncbi:hypothetical protein P170DRAFT_195628 [Aspergillus steynii IBT 23096]|uniref:Uncharacterized protein n=1 Tax=Aspergillus steynii IBT 23096 TaxID=1392250 RepID=A0A2I2G483_9EURO|nr:uncharacterized protein P170DRAFT_195628 [Aspergillus steynii IBT 23096]PLB47681.1 hypothetical protein P170DRAFT_195628 [Aspergillus steynii IBT 23096]
MSWHSSSGLQLGSPVALILPVLPGHQYYLTGRHGGHGVSSATMADGPPGMHADRPNPENAARQSRLSPSPDLVSPSHASPTRPEPVEAV